MLDHLIYFLIVALVLYVVYIVVAKCLPASVLQIVGLIFGIILIIAALRIFGIATP